MPKDELLNIVTEQAKSIGMLEAYSKTTATTVNKLVKTVEAHNNLILKIKSSIKAGLIIVLAVFTIVTWVVGVYSSGPETLQEWLATLKK